MMGSINGVRRIDAQGYELVTVKDGVDRRNTDAAIVTLRGRAPMSHASIRAKRGSDYIENPDTAAIFADSSKYAYDNDGLPLYYYRDAVVGVDDNDDGDFVDEGEIAPVTAQAGSRVRIEQEEFVTRVLDAKRYQLQ